MQRAITVAMLATPLAATGGACGTAPSQLRSLVIRGPSTVPPGTQGMYTLTATLPNGSTTDVTSQATWRAVPSTVVTLTAPGVVTGVANGEGSIFASYEEAGANATVVVLAPGAQFRVSGLVLAPDGVPLDFATVTAMSPGGQVIGQTQTDGTGSYTLSGLAGNVTVQATFDGVTSPPQPVIVVSDTSGINLSLRPPATTVNLSGAWTATFTTSPDCASSLPADTRQQTFAVSIVQAGLQAGSLTDFLFSTSPDGAAAFGAADALFGNVVSLIIPNDNYYGMPIGGLLVRLAPTRWLDIFGSIQGPVTTSAIQGVFSGEFDYYETPATADAPPLSSPPLASCKGTGSATFQRTGGTTSAKRIK